jgi:hypothetical protein
MGIEKWTIYDRYVMEWVNVKCDGWEFMKVEDELV